MQRISTTVIGLVGDGARACAEELARAPNIRVELPHPAAPIPPKRPCNDGDGWLPFIPSG
jgi:hypothetical protein